MNLNKFAAEIHQNAIAHGWWEEERSFGEIIALCHSELSEALEEHRDGRPMLWYACKEAQPEHPCQPEDIYECLMFGQEKDCAYHGKKPEGIAVELVDCIIRILDWCGKEGIDIEAIMEAKHAYNKGRPYRHGGKVL